ncbi:MAG: hypothetical protein C5B49_15050 [Bdellovibrio sp.]|nr:MAG: hypothetical protein C5B49_15050 [Bdellovibrio sp.]
MIVGEMDMDKTSITNKKIEQENFLMPVSVVGVLIPKMATLKGQHIEFKLVTLRGVEYSILADSEWERVLENYRWEEVRIRGLLNSSTMTIVPQWVVPRGPTGETQRVSDEPYWKECNLIGRIKKTVADLVLVSACA